eukprot:TRINITY_DN1354_c0_g1_i4.p1 TRINITY_DN1354_c0_g1~~TRINITY_DN1354_c0_g1_i4.p1  ORF type:complete len:104 (-),score=35.39 TRINITY_DN1354_c0_g1_i4:126-437(-)
MVDMLFFFLMIRRPPRSTQSRSSAASDVYKRQVYIYSYSNKCILFKCPFPPLNYSSELLQIFITNLKVDLMDLVGSLLFQKSLLNQVISLTRILSKSQFMIKF